MEDVVNQVVNLLLSLPTWVSVTIIVLAAAHPVASAIVAMTPTPKDDEWVGRVYKYVIEPLALAIGKAKEKPTNANSEPDKRAP